jgi:hypothetical protein
MRKLLWLISCLAMLGIGISEATANKSGGLLFWAGVALIAAGVSSALTYYLSKKRKEPGIVESDPSGRIPAKPWPVDRRAQYFLRRT